MIQINIDAYDHYKQHQFIYKFQVLEVDSHIIGDENYIKYHINLDYLKNKCYTKNETNEVIKLCQLLIAEEKDYDSLRGDKIMDKAINELEKISGDKKIIGLYDAEKVAEKVMNSRLNYAEKQGIAKGIEKGIKKGQKEGIKQGKAEEKIEIAKKLLSMNMDMNDIGKATGLTLTELSYLK